MKDQALTTEQKVTNYETYKHIMEVRNALGFFATQLLARGQEHDQSKLLSPEVEYFTEYTPKLARTTYGSPEYQQFLKEMKPALDHHYAKNRHHPEHWVNGIYDMNLLDLVEMFCDWLAATRRHHDGNLHKSIDKNAERFEMSRQLVLIFKNTADMFDR